MIKCSPLRPSCIPAFVFIQFSPLSFLLLLLISFLLPPFYSCTLPVGDLEVLLQLLHSSRKTCPDRKVLLIGFSLGAIVVGRYLSPHPAEPGTAAPSSGTHCAMLHGAAMVSGAYSMDFSVHWR